jgi:hypothetical protein
MATGQRQLMFSVLPRQGSYEEARYQGAGMHLQTEFLRVRNFLWSELVSDLRRMVEALGEVKDFGVHTGYRMADFGALILICAESEGWRQEAEAMLKEMTKVQATVLAEKNLMVSVLEEYLHVQPDVEGQMKTRADWHGLLLDAIPTNDRTARAKFTRDYVKYMVGGQGRPMLDARFCVTEGTRENGGWDAHTKTKRYAFKLKMSDDAKTTA